jgi:hypothetical protein
MKTICDIDPIYIEVCEAGSIHVLSAVPSKPVLVGVAMLDASKFELSTAENCQVECCIMLCGVRKGFAGRRFIRRTENEFKRNQEFWNSI